MGSEAEGRAGLYERGRRAQACAVLEGGPTRGSARRSVAERFLDFCGRVPTSLGAARSAAARAATGETPVGRAIRNPVPGTCVRRAASPEAQIVVCRWRTWEPTWTGIHGSSGACSGSMPFCWCWWRRWRCGRSGPSFRSRGATSIPTRRRGRWRRAATWPRSNGPRPRSSGRHRPRSCTSPPWSPRPGHSASTSSRSPRAPAPASCGTRKATSSPTTTSSVAPAGR